MRNLQTIATEVAKPQRATNMRYQAHSEKFDRNLGKASGALSLWLHSLNRKSICFFKIILVTLTLTTELVVGGEVTEGEEKAPSSNTVASNNVVQRIPPLAGMKESPVIAAIALAPQHDLIAVAGDDHSIRILKQSTGETLGVLRGHQGWIQCLEFSSNDNTLVSGSNDGEVWLWNPANNWQGTRIVKKSKGITALTFHPDGQRLAIAVFDEIPFLIDRAGVQLADLKGACTDTRCLLFAADGTLLASGGRDGRLCVWEVTEQGLASEEPKIDEKLHRRRIHALAFSKENSLIYSVGEDRELVQFARLTSEQQARVSIPGLKALSLVLITDHHVAVGGADNSIRIIDLLEKSECSRLVGHQGSVVTLRCHQDELISGSFDTTIRRWSIRKALESSEIDVIPITRKPGTDTSLPTR